MQQMQRPALAKRQVKTLTGNRIQHQMFVNQLQQL